jgi:hypothetical protein
MKSEFEIRREQEELYRKRKADSILKMTEEYKRKKLWEAKMKSIKVEPALTVDELVEKMGGLEKLLEKIGIEKVETVLRSYKIKKLKNKL